jgi:hypothetical protein
MVMARGLPPVAVKAAMCRRGDGGRSKVRVRAHVPGLLPDSGTQEWLRQPSWLGDAVLMACIGAMWSALQLRNSLTLIGNILIARTATKTHWIPFQHVAHVSAGVYGIYIRTSDGLKITSLVAEIHGGHGASA